MMNTSLLHIPAALVLAPLAAAQSPIVLVQDGDVVAGVGNVTAIDGLDVNNSGTWLIQVDTDFTPTPGDGVVLINGAQFARETDALVAPAGAGISSFGTISFNESGQVGWNLNLTGLTTTTDSGIFLGSSLLMQESAISAAPQFSAGTPYIGFFGSKLNDNLQMLVMASVDDAAIASSVDRALVIFQLDGSGALVSESVLLKEGDSITGIAGETVTDFETNIHRYVINDSGQVLSVADLTGLAANNAAIVLNTTSLVREGDPSPLAGRSYENLTGRPIDLNNNGDWVMRADLTGATTDDEVIVKNNTTIIAQEGTSLPGTGGFTFTSFGSGGVRIDDAGNVFWYGDWNDPDTTRDTGIFRNGQLLVQEGVTMAGGQVIEFLAGVQENFAISANGRYLIFEGRRAGGVDAAFLLDLNTLATPFCFGDGTGTACPCGNSGAAGNGCASSVNANGANISVSGNSSLSGDTLLLSGSGMPDSSALYFQGTNQQAGGAGVVFGDGLRCAGGTVVRLKTVTNVAGASQYPQGGDPSVSVRGLVTTPGTRTYQIWYRNAAAFCTPSTFNLSNGVSVSWVM